MLDTTFSVFPADWYHGKKGLYWLPRVRNFFRQSGLYIYIFEGKDLSADSLVVKYREAFRRRPIKRTYLVPLDGVQLGECSMDCGSFHIQRFTSDELEAIFNDRARRAFYELKTVDTERLQEYWLLCVTAEAPPGTKVFPDLDRVEVKYANYPAPVEKALQLLATYDWGVECRREAGIMKEKAWRGFNAPVVVHIDDDLLAYPGPAPDLSLFEPWEPIMGMVTDPDTGEQVSEQVGEEPVFWIDMDDRETEILKTMMQRLDPIISSVRARQNDWPFVEVALGFFVKAFFSEGLEQLLWHITVLEALLGEKGQGVEGRLARRIASIFGKTDEAITRQFKRLYDIRSDLVHGKPFEKDVEQKHLLDARQLTRRTIIWFLHYLHYVEATVATQVPYAGLPTRDGLLILLDPELDRSESLGTVLNSLPREFPGVPDWVA